MTKLLHAGLCPDANEKLVQLGIEPSRIVQVIGNAPASAGVHAQDGTIDGHPYCAAVDLSCHHPSELSRAAVDALLGRLAEAGFAAWHRVPGGDGWPCRDAEHIHAVYAGVPMKAALRRQIHDFCNAGGPELNGLASHARYGEVQATDAQRQAVRALFLAHNAADG